MAESSSDREPIEELAESFLARFRAGERPSLAEYTAAHPELADQIRKLFPALVEMEQAGSAIDRGTDTAAPAAVLDSPRRESLGDYRIIREVGRGGMGIVYEAEQEALGRRVALKVLPVGLAGDVRARARFDREARAAAKLHHTNIVPVFDVGQDGGQVFYAMQMIRGQSLDAVIAELERLRNPSRGPEPHAATSIAGSLLLGRFVPEKLAGTDPGIAAAGPNEETASYSGSAPSSAVLPGQSDLANAVDDRRAYYPSVAQIGQQTASALAYAHARGVIHRDIKPSNLLLDSAGIVWVTDFGLAKTGDLSMTATGDILGTIRYMAPERFRGQCDARADVYALGLTLYELLALKPAFTAKDRLELIEQIRREEPSSPRSLDRKVPRDLETIVLKAIDKDPRRRYQSADELGEDIARFLAGEPVLARRIWLAERLARWVRRNPVVAGLTAAVFLVMAVGTAASNRQANRARAAEAAAIASAVAEKNQRAVAEKQVAQTQAVLEFVEQKILAAARPERYEGGLGRNVTLRQAVEASLPHIAESFRGQPLMEARVRHTLGKSFLYLGKAEVAREQFEAAHALYAKVLGPDHRDTLISVTTLANSLHDLGRHADAGKLREETLALQKVKLGPDHDETLMSMNNLANSYDHLGRSTEALKLRLETLALRKAKLGPDDPLTLTSMLNMANTLYTLGHHSEALKLGEETLALLNDKLGPDHVYTLRSMIILANCHEALGHHAEAIKLYEETLASQRAKLGPDHTDTLTSMRTLAMSYAAAGRNDDALKLRTETLELCKASLGPDHPRTISSQMKLAGSLLRAGSAAEAAALARQAAAQWEKRKGTDAGSLYDSACYRAVSAAAVRAADKSPEGAKQASAEADRAMVWLKQAVAAGWNKAAHMEADPDLDALRDRADFKELLGKLRVRKSGDTAK
jgi:serine/threonine protein kinase